MRRNEDEMPNSWIVKFFYYSTVPIKTRKKNEELKIYHFLLYARIMHLIVEIY
jgi:hypothetical protein